MGSLGLNGLCGGQVRELQFDARSVDDPFDELDKFGGALRWLVFSHESKMVGDDELDPNVSVFRRQEVYRVRIRYCHCAPGLTVTESTRRAFVFRR
jgi:hypothetical protein